MARLDSAWRVIRPIPEVVREVKDLEARFDLQKVFFIDNRFNIPLAHAKAFCQALIDAHSEPLEHRAGANGCDAD